MPLEDTLLECLACPACRAPLSEEVPGRGETPSDGGPERHELVCTSTDCGLRYPVRDDIPVLLVEEARRPA